jgi:hypothetical protein
LDIKKISLLYNNKNITLTLKQHEKGYLIKDFDNIHVFNVKGQWNCNSEITLCVTIPAHSNKDLVNDTFITHDVLFMKNTDRRILSKDNNGVFDLTTLGF